MDARENLLFWKIEIYVNCCGIDNRLVHMRTRITSSDDSTR